MENNSTQPFVVVGIDGSDASKQALRWARSFAAMLRADVKAVAVWHLPYGYGAIALPQDWNPKYDTEELLFDAVTEVVGGTLPHDLHLVIREGNPAKELLDAAKGAELIVVGSRGHGGFAGMLLGSVSSHVAEHADCPVLVVHGDRPPPAAS
ncbi:MAG TPA: universal stress protein [Jatrophihabitantaceae bacterium]|nr:universal stress protein [Jatrophihabitantaceae bacterium]